jgi:hypothetical protein
MILLALGELAPVHNALLPIQIINHVLMTRNTAAERSHTWLFDAVVPLYHADQAVRHQKVEQEGTLLLPGVCAAVTAAMFFREAGASALVVVHRMKTSSQKRKTNEDTSGTIQSMVLST